MGKRHLAILIGVSILASFGWSDKIDITANQILKKAEQKLISNTMVADLSVTVKRPKWHKTIRIKTWTKGSYKALAYVLEPVKDQGVVYLKNNTDVFNYLPNIKKTVKLPANMVSQSWMGSDLSTDDLVKLSRLTSDYTATLIGSLEVTGRDCHLISLVPKEDANVLWGKLVICIDKKDFIQLTTIFYDEDMQKVNTLLGTKIKSIGGKMLATEYVMKPSGRRDKITRVVYNDIAFDVPIEDDFFTKANMPNVKP